MSNWLSFVFSWLARRRQRKAELAAASGKAPLRRRASFPVYKPLASGSITPNSTSGGAMVNPPSQGGTNTPNLAFNSVRGHHTRTISANATTNAQPIQQIHQQMVQPQQTGAGGLYVPPGYVYKTSEGRVGNRRVTVSASAYPGHFIPPQQQQQQLLQPRASTSSKPNTTFSPSHSRTASAPPATAYQPPPMQQVHANVTATVSVPASRTVPAGGSLGAKRSSTKAIPVSQIQYYYDPRTVTTSTTTPVMTQIPTTTPVTTTTTTTTAKTSTSAPTPRTSRPQSAGEGRISGSGTSRRQAPIPPSTPRRKSSRTPLSAQPQQQAPTQAPVTPLIRTSTIAGTTAPQAANTTATTTATSSKRVVTGRRNSTAPTTVTSSTIIAPPSTQPYNSSPRKVVEAFNRYNRFWQGAYSPRSLTFSSIPWPVVDSPKHPTSLNVNAVRSFLLSPHHSQGVPARERVEHAQSIWEPKSFIAMYGDKMRDEEDKEKVERTLLFLQGTLRILYNEVVAAESVDHGAM